MEQRADLLTMYLYQSNNIDLTNINYQFHPLITPDLYREPKQNKDNLHTSRWSLRSPN
jgi:hypothetical protein